MVRESPGKLRQREPLPTIKEVSEGASSSSSVCSYCADDDLPAQHVCFDCKIVLCDPCKNAHVMMQTAQGHTVEKISEENREKAEELGLAVDSRCPRHPEFRRDPCTICSVLGQPPEPPEMPFLTVKPLPSARSIVFGRSRETTCGDKEAVEPNQRDPRTPEPERAQQTTQRIRVITLDSKGRVSRSGIEVQLAAAEKARDEIERKLDALGVDPNANVQLVPMNALFGNSGLQLAARTGPTAGEINDNNNNQRQRKPKSSAVVQSLLARLRGVSQASSLGNNNNEPDEVTVLVKFNVMHHRKATLVCGLQDDTFTDLITQQPWHGNHIYFYEGEKVDEMKTILELGIREASVVYQKFNHLDVPVHGPNGDSIVLSIALTASVGDLHNLIIQESDLEPETRLDVTDFDKIITLNNLNAKLYDYTLFREFCPILSVTISQSQGIKSDVQAEKTPDRLEDCKSSANTASTSTSNVVPDIASLLDPLANLTAQLLQVTTNPMFSSGDSSRDLQPSSNMANPLGVEPTEVPGPLTPCSLGSPQRTQPCDILTDAISGNSPLDSPLGSLLDSLLDSDSMDFDFNHFDDFTLEPEKCDGGASDFPDRRDDDRSF